MSIEKMLPFQKQKAVVNDLTGLFNQLVNSVIQEQESRGYQFRQERRSQILEDVTADIATIVDFQTGNMTALRSTVVHANTLGSSELSAIEFTEHLNNYVGCGKAPDAFSILYRVIDDVSKAKGFSFNPTYKP